MDQLRTDIKLLGEKLDNHFNQFGESFEAHEKMEVALIEMSSKRLDKMESMMLNIRDKHDHEYKNFSKKIRTIYILLFFAYLLLTIIEIWKN